MFFAKAKFPGWNGDPLAYALKKLVSDTNRMISNIAGRNAAVSSGFSQLLEIRCQTPNLRSDLSAFYWNPEFVESSCDRPVYKLRNLVSDTN